jgi:hypothetical protein
MNCKECLPLIPGYLDEELSERQSASLRQHLMDCPSCRKELGGEKSLRRWFEFEEAGSATVPAGFAQRVARRAFAGDTGELASEVAHSAGAARARDEEGALLRFVLHATAAAAVLLLVLSAWMRNVNLPDSDHMSAAEPTESVEQLVQQADRLNAQSAEQPAAEVDER